MRKESGAAGKVILTHGSAGLHRSTAYIKFEPANAWSHL
jgi:hypothetical protein